MASKEPWSSQTSSHPVARIPDLISAGVIRQFARGRQLRRQLSVCIQSCFPPLHSERRMATSVQSQMGVHAGNSRYCGSSATSDLAVPARHPLRKEWLGDRGGGWRASKAPW